MARLCRTCRQPVAPVNECICPDEDEEAQDSSEEEDAA